MKRKTNEEFSFVDMFNNSLFSLLPSAYMFIPKFLELCLLFVHSFFMRNDRPKKFRRNGIETHERVRNIENPKSKPINHTRCDAVAAHSNFFFFFLLHFFHIRCFLLDFRFFFSFLRNVECDVHSLQTYGFCEFSISFLFFYSLYTNDFFFPI